MRSTDVKIVLKNFVFNIMFVASGEWIPYLLAFKLQIVSTALLDLR